jgi:hypothetical protein
MPHLGTKGARGELSLHRQLADDGCSAGPERIMLRAKPQVDLYQDLLTLFLLNCRLGDSTSSHSMERP